MILTAVNTNQTIVLQVLEELVKAGVQEVIICPGGRNTPFVAALEKSQSFKQYFWSEERSAAFFALGRSKLTRKPVAVIVTSGTAAGELLPAAMEAYYTEVPLLLITADRPRRFRGTGAPQTAEQVGLFGQYAIYEQDFANDEICSLADWTQRGAAHLNICLEEPLNQTFENIQLTSEKQYKLQKNELSSSCLRSLDEFVRKSHRPFVVVSAIPENSKESVVRFLLDYKAPVYAEAVSGLRDDQRLNHLRIQRTENIWNAAQKANYPIDGILRIGGIPTFRLWRDLENLSDKIHVCSISENSFTGLSWGTVNVTNLHDFFEQYQINLSAIPAFEDWRLADQQYVKKLHMLFVEEPESEAVLIHQLSKRLSSNTLLYLGNSLPIREWDAYAEPLHENIRVFANRGLNGIDGQISTFLGMCTQQSQNWGIFGDLTTIYDLAGPWILDQMREIDLNLVVINNGGGRIFARMFPQKQIQNPHSVQFKPLAELWKMSYERYTQLPKVIPYGGHRLIEIVPSEESTERFWKKLSE